MKAPRLVLIATTLAFAALAPAAAPRLRVGLVTDIGGIDDKSFNQITWEGIERFAGEKGLAKDKEYAYLQSASDADYGANLAQFAERKFDLVIAPGFLMADAVPQAARDYPATRFVLIDCAPYPEGDYKNILSILFKEHEGSFLVGVAAGLKAKADSRDAVGFLGGMQFPLIEKFEAGFTAGVKAVYPECRVLVEYAGDFGKPELGQKIAKRMYDSGAYVIFHAAGGTGNGIFLEARLRSEHGVLRYAIGVDRDQYDDGAYELGGVKRSVTLTSMLKRVDVAAHLACTLAYEGKSPGGTIMILGIAEGGVSLPAENPNLSADMLAIIEGYRARIASGALVVPEAPNPADRASASGPKRQP